MKQIFLLLLIIVSQAIDAQELIQLIGLDTNNSELSKYSYSVMYDGENPEVIEAYVPYKTLGIYRNGDSIEILELPYLLIPTKKGFTYASIDIVEKKVDENTVEQYDLPSNTLESYSLEKSITKPIFFKSKSRMMQFVQNLKPSFADALYIDFQNFSFINSLFYTTTGFESEVHGGATWFNAHEKMNIYPIDWNKGNISNLVLDYLPNSEKNNIIINTINLMEDYGSSDEEVDENMVLPWSSSINEFKDVFFDFTFQGDGVAIYPKTLLQGNSSRAFLAEGPMIENEKLYSTFQVNKPNTLDLITFISPENSTQTIIESNTISIYDLTTGNLLKSIDINFNRVIMNEYALGRYCKKWKSEF